MQFKKKSSARFCVLCLRKKEHSISRVSIVKTLHRGTEVCFLIVADVAFQGCGCKNTVREQLPIHSILTSHISDVSEAEQLKIIKRRSRKSRPCYFCLVHEKSLSQFPSAKLRTCEQTFCLAMIFRSVLHEDSQNELKSSFEALIPCKIIGFYCWFVCKYAWFVQRIPPRTDGCVFFGQSSI